MCKLLQFMKSETSIYKKPLYVVLNELFYKNIKFKFILLAHL